jgi:pimeloyl-ACP methyl ester carboxylesterase
VTGALLALLLAQAAPAPAVPPDVAARYVHPGQAVELEGGRKLNLLCMGSGKRTVLFDAGGSDWSVIWALVQPAVAGRARACAYDRAGLGYSDPARGPRTPIAIVEDMHALIHAAKLQTPLVLVGHSLGGFNVKLYAALYPEDVAGLVLVDPAEERAGERMRPFLRLRYGASIAARNELLDLSFFPFLVDRYRACAEAAKAKPLDPQSDFYKRCSDPVRAPLGPDIAAERARIQVGAAYQEAQASEIAYSVYGDLRGDAAYKALFRPGMLGARPMVVLTHGIYDPADPIDVASTEGWLRLHAEDARLSTRGRRRTVPDTHHNIEIEAPQAIVAAIAEVLDDLDRPPAKKRRRAKARRVR